MMMMMTTTSTTKTTRITKNIDRGRRRRARPVGAPGAVEQALYQPLPLGRVQTRSSQPWRSGASPC